MDKRYQVFVSSTYADLKEERRKVIQTLMEMDCIPSGMEIFPAADEDQWNFIKKVIDDCDYYVITIGGRYGSTTTDGVSYTEKEYDYAVEKGLKVLAFLHEKPEEIPVGKSDIDAEARARLKIFREKVATGRLVRFWTNANELPGLVALSLSKTMKTYPAVGWVRADQVPSSDVLVRLDELQRENDQLRADAMDRVASKSPKVVNLAGLDVPLKLGGTYFVGSPARKRPWSVELTWGELFAALAPWLLNHPADPTVDQKLAAHLFSLSREDGRTPSLNDQDFQTVKVQLMALNLANVRYSKTVQGGMGLFWSLTPRGQELMLDLRTVKTSKA